MVQREKIGAVLVVGAGVGGMRAATDLADAGMKVYLVEQSSSIGGVVAQLGFMFPTHDCVLCRGTSDHGYGCTRPSITPWLLDFSQHPSVELMTLTEIESVSGQPGHFVVTVRHKPRYVDTRHCINCDKCAQVCPVELPQAAATASAESSPIVRTPVIAASFRSRQNLRHGCRSRRESVVKRWCGRAVDISSQRDSLVLR